MFDFFQLKRPLKREANVDLEDVFKVKTTLNDLGHYDAPDWGITEYPDDGLFKGIKSFQRKHGLKVDGIMNPGGETERMMGALSMSGLGKQRQKKRDRKQGVQLAAAAAPAIPWIASQLPGWAAGVAGMLGLTLPLGGDAPKDDNCDHQLYKVDMPTCNAIARRRGKQAGARCRSTAMERYAACLAGKPRDQWPPLDTWNN